MNGFDPRRRQSEALSDRLHARWDRLARSGFVTVAGILLALAVAGGLWMAHVRGRFHQLTTTQDLAERSVNAPRPGGQDLAHLSRLEVAGALVPELTGATLAPGDGMLLLQTALTLPGAGEVPILLGTPESDTPSAASGLTGAELSARVQTREGTRWTAPLELIAGRASSQQDTAVLPGGSRAEAHFAPDVAAGTGAVVQTGVETGVSVSLTNRGLELSVTAKNTSSTPRAVAVAWTVPVLVPKAGLQSVSILPPPHQAAGSVAEPGELLLGRRDVDQTFSSLQHTYLSSGPELLLRNPTAGYNLRFTALSASIKSLRVQAGQHDRAIVLTFSTATGSAADKQQTTIAPGDSLQWRVRMEATAPEQSSGQGS